MTIFASLVLFAIYLNVPAVLVRIHGFPFVLGAIIPMLLLVPLFFRIVLRQEPIRMHKLLWAALVLLLIQALSALFALRPQDSFEFIFEWLTEGVLICFLIFNVFRTKRDVLVAVHSLLFAGGFMGILVLLQWLFGTTSNDYLGFAQLDSELSNSAGESQPRVAGPIGETNRFAQVMLVLAPLSVAFSMVSTGWRRVGYHLLTALILGGMMLAYSRGAIVAMAIAVPVALYFGTIKVKHILVGTGIGVLLVLASPVYLDRISSIGSVMAQAVGASPVGVRNADGAARGRLTEMKAAALQFVDHPILGVGPGMAPNHYAKYAVAVGGNVRPGTRRSHNLYLQILAETGLFGLLAFLTVITICWLGLNQARLRYVKIDRQVWALATGLQLALLLFLVTSVFLHTAYIRYFWLLVGICIAASSLVSKSFVRDLADRLIHTIRNQLQITT